MKKTALRVWSILLTLCLLMGVLSVGTYADGIVITKQPVSVEAAAGEQVTLTVEAEGEDLRYAWYTTSGYPLGEYPGFVHADKATLVIESASCRYNDWEFFCEVYQENDWIASEHVTVTVPHKEPEPWNYFYHNATHIVFCDNCGSYHSEKPHEWGDGTLCDVCGYDAQNPVYTPPVFLNEYQTENAAPGDDVEFYMDVYGQDVTYQWYKQKMSDDPDVTNPVVKLQNGNGISGVTTDRLTLESVTCDMSGYFFICEATNSAGVTEQDASLYVQHFIKEWKPMEGGAYHMAYCICGEEQGSEYHVDKDCNGVCEVCKFTFPAGAPKITAQPKDAKVKNGHEPVKFTVAATGSNLTYQWYEMGSPIEANEKFSGVDTPTLTVKSTYNKAEEEYDCAGWYGGFYCIITNEKGAVSSVAATYEVEHEAIVEYLPWDEYSHELYCVCGSWVEDRTHVDKNANRICDLCGDEMAELFPDANPDAWHYEAMAYVKANELFVGDDAGKFNPDKAITRGEVVTVLARALMSEENIKALSDEEFKIFLNEIKVEGAKTSLTDIKGKFYDRHAQLLAALGIVNGYEDGSFRGQKTITREELAAMLVRFITHLNGGAVEGLEFGTTVDSFKDAGLVADWAKEAVDAAREMGLFKGDENANLMPKANSTRAQVAETLRRAWITSGMMY